MKNRPKRRIIQDRTIPGSDQINKHQNFDRLLNDHALIKKIFFKKLLIWSAAAIGAATVVGVILTTNHSEEKQVKAPTPVVMAISEAPFIQPPLPGNEVPFTTYKISGEKGATITYPNGSTLIIPPLAFINKNGVSIKDSIEIKHREFHNPCDIFLSGIPMTYDSAGTNYTFESAGMIETRAFDKNEELNLANGKKIDVSMVSASNETRFNLYKLDESAKKWIHLGKDHIRTIAASSKTKEETKIKQPVIEETKSIQPKLSDPQKYSFKIKYEESNFPELAAYKDVLFEVTDEHFKPAYFKINWDNISLYNAKEEGNYLVKLKKKDTTISVTAVPVFDKAHYQEALSEFNKKHNEASITRDQKEFDKTSKLNSINKELSKSNSRSSDQLWANYQTYTRSFIITSTGIHNCDFPLPPNPIVYNPVKTKMVDEKGSELIYSTIFIVEKGKNAVSRFSKNDDVRYNKQAQNLIWTITDKNNIAFFNTNDFTNASTGNNIKPLIASNQTEALEKIKQFSQ